MNRLDEISQKKYGMTYDALSAWGKWEVERDFFKDTPPKIDAPHNVSLGNVPPGLEHENQRLSAHNDALVQENAELWHENADLRAELAELRSQIQ